MHNMSELIKGCLKNDRQAQRKLFETCNPLLVKSAFIMTQDAEKTKEVVQETWIDVFKGLRGYDASRSTIMTWMKTILVRKVWKLQKDTVPSQSIDLSTLNPVTDEDILSRLSCEDILDQMRAIPSASRMVLQLYVFEGFKHREIAEMLHITESTSRVHLTKARRIMQNRINIINQTRNHEPTEL